MLFATILRKFTESKGDTRTLHHYWNILKFSLLTILFPRAFARLDFAGFEGDGRTLSGINDGPKIKELFKPSSLLVKSMDPVNVTVNAQRPWGITMETNQKKALAITEVKANSPAGKLGLMKGLVLTSVGGVRVNDAAHGLEGY